MQPLQALNNVQKARLLHALFILEIPAFLTYVQQLCLYMVNHEAEVRAAWQDQLFSVEFWLELSRDAHLKIGKYGRKLEQSSVLFSEQLFDGYGALFLNHCLSQYAAQGKNSDPKFKTAVDLLINP